MLNNCMLTLLFVLKWDRNYLSIRVAWVPGQSLVTHLEPEEGMIRKAQCFHLNSYWLRRMLSSCVFLAIDVSEV